MNVDAVRDLSYANVPFLEAVTVSLTSGKISKYSLEWIIACIDWAQNLNKRRVKITLPKLLKAIKNEAARDEFLVKWQRKNGPVHLPADYSNTELEYDTSKYAKETSRL